MAGDRTVIVPGPRDGRDVSDAWIGSFSEVLLPVFSAVFAAALSEASRSGSLSSISTPWTVVPR